MLQCAVCQKKMNRKKENKRCLKSGRLNITLKMQKIKKMNGTNIYKSIRTKRDHCQTFIQFEFILLQERKNHRSKKPLKGKKRKSGYFFPVEKMLGKKGRRQCGFFPPEVRRNSVYYVSSFCQVECIAFSFIFKPNSLLNEQILKK